MKHLYGYNVHGLQVMPLPEPPCYCQQGFVTFKSTGGAKSTSRQIEDLIAEAKALATPRYELPRPKTPTIQWCNARSVEGWNICLWGNPKLTVVCGKCMGTTRTRDYVTVTNREGQIACKCDHCGAMNLTGLLPND